MLVERQLATLHLPAILDMASGIVADESFRGSLSRRDVPELDRVLADNFRQWYVASGKISLLSLNAFDANLVPVAGTTTPSFPGVPWDKFVAGAADRTGLERKRIAARYMLDSADNPVHVMIFPVGALRTIGYLGIVTSPLPALAGLAKTLGAGVTIRSVAGRELLNEAPEPAADPAAPANRIYDVVGTSFATPAQVELFRLFIKTDVTAYELAAKHVQRVSYAVALSTIIVMWTVGLWLLRATVFRRISRISSALRRIAAGDGSVEVPSAGRDEIGRMSRDLRTVIGYVSEIVTLKERLSRINAKLTYEITERKRIELDLRAAKEKAELASRAKSEFLANMSHELRTPLNAIIGFSEVMKNETLGPVGSAKYLGYAQDIHDSGHHLLAHINDILDLAKIESGTEELHEESIPIAEFVQSVLRLVQRRAESIGVDVAADYSDELPSVYADRRKLTQILLNLLTNAVKFTRSGGKVVLKLECRADSGHVFQVIDTGIGISFDDISIALAPFQQIDSGLNRKHEGTGLGLPLTKSLVEMHGGSLDLQSQVGVGTTVTVRFPAERIVRSPHDAEASGAADRKAG